MKAQLESVSAGAQPGLPPAQAMGEAPVAGTVVPPARTQRRRQIDVKALRSKVGMTQAQFASRFGFSPATLRHWERGDRAPQGPALVLLQVISHNPNAVIEALKP
jgi:putative transcriptional regulator